MAETLKFGPEWLRALSDGTNVTSPPPSPAVGLTSYKLAEHRYGREEMLALRAPTREIPEELKDMPVILSEKPLQPLALIPLSHEEQKLMTQSVNSSLALRMMGRGNSIPPGGLRGGRGGLDRGKGRGRGRGDGYYGRGFDDDPGHGRGRIPRDSWDEGRGGRYDRSYPPGRSFEDEVISSPHREFSRSMSSENWRESKRENDDDGDWRRAPTRERWNNYAGPRNWREPRERYDGYEGKGHFNDNRDRSAYDRGRLQRTHSLGSGEDGTDLPEWSTADVDDMDGLGTFDSSGAFMSRKQLEETANDEEVCVNGREGKKFDDHGNGKEQVDMTKESSSREQKSKGNLSSKEREKNGFKEMVEANKLNNQQKASKDTLNTMLESKSHSSENKTSKESKAKNYVEQTDLSKARDTLSKDSRAKQQQPDKTPSEPVKHDKLSKPSSSESSVSQSKQPLAAVKASEAAAILATADAAVAAEKVTGDKPEEDDANFDHLEKAAENLVADLGAEEEKELPTSGAQPEPSHALPPDHEDAEKWFYRDPQGDLQGPFTSSEMAEWFSAGYFTMNLMVKRGCDERFQPLGDLIKSWGRIPFKNSPEAVSLPELSTVPLIAATSPLGLSAAAVAGLPAAVPSVIPAVGLPNPADNPEQLKALQHQMVLPQQLVQQQLLRQMQLQQIMQQLQKQPDFAALSLVQLQNQAYDLFLQQQMLLMPQPQPVVPQQQQPQQQQQQQHLQQKPSPRPVAKSETLPHTLPQPVQAEAPGFQRAVTQPGTDDVAESIWALGIPGSSGASAPPSWKQQRARTLWEVDLAKIPSVEEIQQQEAERLKREQEEQEANQKRLEEERRNEERKKKELEERERMEREKQERLEREKQEQLEREKQKALEMERRREQEEEEKRRQQQLEEQRRQEEEKRKIRKEKERRKEEKLRQLEQEELMKKELEEKKRQEEIKRRQQQAQHQEALRQISREQLGNIQLPATAQWGSSTNTSGPSQTSTLSLTQIQQMEAERERKEQEKKMELQRQLMNVMQQQQQQQQLQSRSWASKAQSSHVATGVSAPSLLEIQQEQARQLQENSSKSQVPKPSLAQSTSGVWGGTTTHSSNWAQEGAWGNPKTKPTLGFWDDAVSTTQTPTVQRMESSQKKGILNSSNFPSLSSSQTTNGCRPATSRSKPKPNKEEETVQRLFQNLKPKDEFTQWCENALKGIQSNVDIPTFVAFLIDVESPYEVQEYARSYLGETRETTEFARQFLEKRSKYKNQLRQQQQAEDGIWGLTAANHSETRSQVNHIQNNSTAAEESKNSKKKKKKMQKLDQKCLGFTVHAAPDRHNVGEIETSKVE